MDEMTIRSELERIRKQIEGGNESELWIWAIKDRLACAQRPLRDNRRFGGGIGKSPPPLPPEARRFVEDWVGRVVKAGFRSIICLLEKEQLERHYVRGGIELHPEGLLGYYRSCGLDVRNIRCTDYRKPTDEQMREILVAFRSLPEPVLMHCSAAIDRTTPVAEFIVQQECAK